jgi:hypothetical protein
MLLKDFYRDTVDLNDSLKGGWGNLYYGVFSDVIREHNYKNIAEIGIGYGTHAKYILKNNDIEKLYLIDPMKKYENDGFVDDILKHETTSYSDHFEEMYDLINNELEPWKNKYKWFRQESITITEEQIANESLDCVFIDGNHEYSYVLKDLNFWWQKIRVNGQLLGDDYSVHPGVPQAVHEFVKEKNLKLDLLNKKDCDHIIYRIKKIN